LIVSGQIKILLSEEYSLNAFLETFGVSVPLVQGPMGGVSGPELVSAVVNAGALGVLPIWAAGIDSALSAISSVQARTDKRFAVNLLAAGDATVHVTSTRQVIRGH